MDVDQPLAQPTAHNMLSNDNANDTADRDTKSNDLQIPPLLTDNLRSMSDDILRTSNLEDSPPRPEDRLNHATRSDQPLLSLDATTELFKSRIDDARLDTEHALAGNEEVSDVVKPKLTLDLGHSNISRLPEAVVDLIKTEVERLSLSHNQIWHIPLRFSECSHLRYLNIRSNIFREIPRGIYKLPELEILDVSRNKVRKIPKDIRNLTSLRVLSIIHNRIDDLPTEICEMTKLQKLKVAENPLRSKLKKIVEAKEAELALSDMTDSARDFAMTAEIKRYLREQHPVTALIENDHVMVNEEPHTDHPRPMRRVMSSRFPVVPSGQSMDGISDSARSSPVQTARPPPIPIRSHYRGASGQFNTQRRPSITPLVNGSERNRSNSESVLQQNGPTRQRRMGILRKEKSDLDAIDETKAARHSHLRGFSHGSALRRSSVIASPVVSNSPSSPRETRTPMTPSLKRLSCLPEIKPTTASNPLIEGAKGLLYALHQIEMQIKGLLGVVRNNNNNTKRSSLEPTFYNASRWTKRLNKALENADSVDFEDTEASERAQNTVQQLCIDCVMTYKHVISQLQDNIRNVVVGIDARYVRTLIIQLFGSIVEVKNAMKSFGVEFTNHTRQMSSGNTNPIQTIPEEYTPPKEQRFSTITPVRDRSDTRRQGGRLRSDTAIQHPPIENLVGLQPVQPMHPPPSARLPPSMQLSGSTLNGNSYGTTSNAYTNGNSFGVRSRSNSRHALSNTNSSFSSVANTPRSGEGFNLPSLSLSTRINPTTGMTDIQEEACFEQIYLALTKSYDAALQAVPYARKQFQRCLEAAEENRQPKEVRDLWITLIQRCKACQDMSEALQIRLTNMRIKDSGYGTLNAGGGRNDPSFWLLCKTFLQSFVDLVTDMREAKDLRLLPQEIMLVLRPVHKASRDVGRLIETGPWRNLTDGVASLPAPTPYTPIGPINMFSAVSSQQTNGYTNGVEGGIHAYRSAITHQQIQQSLNTNVIASPPTSTILTPISAISAPLLQPPMAQANGVGAAISPTVQFAATPLSAALGPAAQATIPSTPASAIGDSFFRGDVFQRADSLLNMQSAGGTVNFLNRR